MHKQATPIYLLGNLRSIGAGLGREAHFRPEPHQHWQPDQDWRVYFQGSPLPHCWLLGRLSCFLSGVCVRACVSVCVCRCVHMYLTPAALLRPSLSLAHISPLGSGHSSAPKLTSLHSPCLPRISLNVSSQVTFQTCSPSSPWSSSSSDDSSRAGEKTTHDCFGGNVLEGQLPSHHRRPQEISSKSHSLSQQTNVIRELR